MNNFTGYEMALREKDDRISARDQKIAHLDAELADKDRTIERVRALVEEWRWINGGAHFSHELLAALEGKQ